MEFRIALGWRIVMYTLALLLGALGVWMLFGFISSGNRSGFWLDLLTLFLSIGIICGAAYSFLRIHKEKITSKNRIFVHQLAFSVRRIEFDNVLGFRIDENYFHILPKEEQFQQLRVSSYIEKREAFLEILYKNFESLDNKDRAKEASEIYSNSSFGINSVEVDARLSLARKTVSGLLKFSFVATLWAWFYPRPYELVILINILIPIIAILAFIHFKGLIKLDGKKNSLYPIINPVLVLPTSALGLRCILDYNFLEINSLLIISFGLGALVFISLFIYSTELKRKNLGGVISTLLYFGLIYGYILSSISILNVMLDTSPVYTYKAEVFSKHKSKYTETVQLTSGWIDGIDKQVKATISTSFYNRVQERDSVLVNVRNGTFNSSWIIIEEVIFSTDSDYLNTFKFKEDSSIFKID